MSNLDEASEAVKHFLDLDEAVHCDSDLGLVVSLLASPTLLGLAPLNVDNLNIVSIYQYLKDYWVSAPSRQLFKKTRLTIDNRARQAAATLCLACIGVQYRRQDRAPVEVLDNAASEPNVAEVDTNATASGADITDDSCKITALSSTSIHPAAISLQKYMTISRPPPIPSKTFADMVAHWTPGFDPHAYDYTATTAVLSGITNIAGSGMSGTTQEKLHRRRDRAVVREAQLTVSRNKRLKLDPRFVGGQPNTMHREWASSQAVAGGESNQATQSSQMQLGISSQIEPGRHGGRLVLRGKRKAGF